MQKILRLTSVLLVCSYLGMTGVANSAESAARIAVFADSAVPKTTEGCADPKRLADLLRTPQREVVFLDAKQVADPKQLSPESVDLLVLPYGPSFPKDAEDSLKAFLKAGGDFVSVGGYAFDNLYGAVVDPTVELLKVPTLESEDAVELWPSDQANAQTDDLSQLSRSLTTDRPHSGERCIRLHVPDGLPKAWYNVNQKVASLTPGESYVVTCWIRTENVHDGFAYLAVSFHDASGKRLSFVQDGGGQSGSGTTDWRQFQCNFEVPPKTVSARVVGNLYGFGTAYFDDFSLKWVSRGGLNTHYGKVGDQVRFKDDQIGAFDASDRLAGAVVSHTSTNQSIVTGECAFDGLLTGYAAVGMTSPNDAVRPKSRARWTSLVQSQDGYGRRSGSILGISHNFTGTFKHSLWAYTGVENRDLFDGSCPAFETALREVVDHMLGGVFLHTPAPEFMCYRPGETVKAGINVCNSGKQDRKLRVAAELVMDGVTADSQALDLSLAAGEDRQIGLDLTCPKGERDVVCVLRYRLSAGEREIDTMRTGLFVPNGDEDRGLPLSFRDNFFRVGRKPMMLFGVNQTGVMFGPSYENPLTWAEDYGRCRDFGLNVWRVLHVSPYADPDWNWKSMQKLDNPPEALLRRMDAAFMLAQHYDVAPLPCWYDWTAGAGASDAELQQQAAFARVYGERYRKLSGMLYDVSNEITVGYTNQPDLHREFRAFLTERYGTDEALRAAWGDDTADLATAKYEKPSGGWCNRKAHDIELFRIQVMERWLAPSIDAVRETGDRHPVTTENYVSKLPGGDAFESRRRLTFANMHHYGDWKPGYARFFARHMQGRGHTIGEFGRGSHPASESFRNYLPEPEAVEYFRRTVFLNVGLSTAGMFVWDMKDLRGSGFFYGIHYHSELVPKKVGYEFRNLALFFRRFVPDYEPEALWVVIPDHFLLGAGQNDLQMHLYNALTALTRTNVPFSTLRQYNLARILKDKPKAVMLPLSYILTDEDVDMLTTYVKRGGHIYLSGDCAFTPDREETRQQVLKTLAGVEPIARRFPDIRVHESPAVPVAATPALPGFDACPTYELRPGNAQVLRQAGSLPLVCEHRIGKGTVTFVNDPIELHLAEDELVPIYADFANRVGLEPLLWTPMDSKLLVFRTRTAKGGALTVVLNDGEEDRTVSLGNVQLACPAGSQAAVYRTRSGQIPALALPGSATIDGKPFRNGSGYLLLTAMDGKDLRSSHAILALPLSTGRMGLTDVDVKLSAEIGEIVGGEWNGYERPDNLEFEIDDLRSTGMFLLTHPDAREKWAGKTEEMVLKPEKMDRL